MTVERTFEPGFGMRTLFAREIRRFMRVPGQTVLSPLVTTVLYFVVFGLTLGVRPGVVPGESYARFIVPGLVMLGVVSNTFLNTSSSLFMLKMQGTIVDLLVTPLTYVEIIAAFVGAALVRGFVVGIATWIVAGLFTTFQVAHPVATIGFVLLVGVFFATAGLLTAVWADKFEQVNLFPTFVITPLTFLGGVFYSVDRLPAILQPVARANPMLYMVEGMRYGLLGHSDVAPWSGAALLIVLNVVAITLAYRWLKSGYKLRS